MKRIIGSILLVVVLFLSACTTDIERDKMKKVFSNDENYVTIIGKITYVGEGYNDSVIIWIEQLDDYEHFQKTDSFRIVSDSYKELLINDFILEKGEELFKFTSSEVAFWNGWFYPIVAVENLSSDKTYLDFGTGKSNWLNYIQNEI